MSDYKDLTGKCFGRLVVESFDKMHMQPSGKAVPRWLCKCDCGVVKSVMQRHLKSGNTQSCGCLNKERSTKSGMHGTRPYKIWHNMKQRCENLNSTNYAKYGAKGIVYDPKWKTFKGFWEDMEVGYKDNLTLDRINSKGNYCKDNCQWTTTTQQNRNQGKMSSNTSGKTGVYLQTKEGKPAYWCAQWYTLSGERKSKTFSLSKYGGQEAFRLACEYRDNQIESLNNQGAGYSDGHGV